MNIKYKIRIKFRKTRFITIFFNFQKAKSMVPLLVPLFVSAFRRAEDLAMAMEARCYNGGEGRTKMKPLKYKTADYVAYIFLLVFLAAVICLAIWVSFPF